MESTKKANYVYKASVISRLINIFFSLLVIYLIYIGWRIREDRLLTPEFGIGYIFGIAGTVMMFLLLLYPARKKFRFMNSLGSTEKWFKAHMIMGILGPVLILFHCNFHLGSLNSRVALFSTLFIALSGVIGRYIYKKINYGFSRKQISLKMLKKDIEEDKNNLKLIFSYAPKLKELLNIFEYKVKVSYERSLLSTFFHVMYINSLYRVTHFKIIRGLNRALKIIALREKWDKKKTRAKVKESRKVVNNHLSLIVNIAEFNFYERLFALWHLLHYPLFILLVMVVVVHVIAVHMY